MNKPPSSYLNVIVGTVLVAIIVNVLAPTMVVRADLVQGKNVGRNFFADMLEQELNIAAKDFALDALEVWQRYENTAAYWNPLATTWKMPGSWDFNPVGVQNYPDRTTGIQATGNTLALSYYDAIRTMFKEEAFNRSQIRSALVTWSGEGAYVDNLLNEWETLWNNRSTSDRVRYVGPFHNTSSDARGSVVIDLALGADTVSGYIDFTNNPGVGALCGAGSFSGTRNGNQVQFSFTSNDSDDGCTMDDGWEFDVSATLSGDELTNGSYSISNGQSGTFSAKQTQAYSGRFTNASNGLQGNVQIDLALGSSSVAGYIDFTNDPSGDPLCGAGSFVGTREGDAIDFSFLSNDSDSGCTFDDGWTFNIGGTVSGNRITNGSYYIPNNGQSGSFSASTPDSTEPSGEIDSPGNLSIVGSGTIDFTAQTWDNTGGSGVDRVEFWIKYNGGWHKVGQDSSAPYGIEWHTPAGMRSQLLIFAIHVFDNAGNEAVDAGGYHYVPFVASHNEPDVDENWVPQDQRAYLNQRALPNGDKKCSASGMAMLLAMNGLLNSDHTSMAAKANEMYPRVLVGKTAFIYKMRNELRNQGATSDYHNKNANDGWELIKQEVDAGRPLIVRTVHGVVTAKGHFIVAVGYKETGENRELIVYDPYGRWLGTCCDNNYDRNTTASSSRKGRWVQYDFDRVFGTSNWLITARDPQAVASYEVDNSSEMMPDPISDEPENIGTYEGVEDVTKFKVYLPMVTKE
jgi:hypothetical protein